MPKPRNPSYDEEKAWTNLSPGWAYHGSHCPSMLSVEDAAICPTHGWLSPVFLHVAGPAVAADDHDIRFDNVTGSTRRPAP